LGCRTAHPKAVDSIDELKPLVRFFDDAKNEAKANADLKTEYYSFFNWLDDELKTKSSPTDAATVATALRQKDELWKKIIRSMPPDESVKLLKQLRQDYDDLPMSLSWFGRVLWWHEKFLRKFL
jgi:hypothetical protein